ncbi:hypothetical protein [Qipengyuania sediminis]|uniref:hypothetical protein n=1 Tax=Qipengyuania sediminis TaxID=1532023 RepID=UPI00105A7DEA|nr:hypothetical protein [Qipengyuania sediminis]
MSRETNRAECVNILGEDAVAQIERGIVERHRQSHSDSEMWAMLNQREERMASLMKTIGKVGTMLSVDSLSENEAKMWRGQMDRLSREYAGHVDFCDCLIWHMGKRGLIDPADWREGWQDFINASALDWWSVH